MSNTNTAISFYLINALTGLVTEPFHPSNDAFVGTLVRFAPLGSSPFLSGGVIDVTREMEVYSLDATIAVGYRVNSIKATHFGIYSALSTSIKAL